MSDPTSQIITNPQLVTILAGVIVTVSGAMAAMGRSISKMKKQGGIHGPCAQVTKTAKEVEEIQRNNTKLKVDVASIRSVQKGHSGALQSIQRSLDTITTELIKGGGKR